MKSAEIRQKFLDFFESKGHTIVPLELNRARIGTVVEALVDGADEEFLFCRSYAEAADVDGIIKVPHCGNPVPAGSYVSIKITGADYYDLCGELVPSLKTVMR